MKLLTKRNLELKSLKEIRSGIGKWFIISTLVCYIAIIHNINVEQFKYGLTVNQCIFLLFVLMSDIISLMCLFDINKQIKKIQGYI